MKKIILFKDKGMKDIFDDDDNVKNVMTPSSFSAKKLGLSDKQAFLYKGFPMYLDRTVVHARKEDIPHVQELFKESVEELDEISSKKMEDYIDKAKEDGVKEYQKNGMSDKFKKRLEGIKTAAKKSTLKRYENGLKGVKEDIEQIDELSKKTLGRYISKASRDLGVSRQLSGQSFEKRDHQKLGSKENQKYHDDGWRLKDVADKRQKGIDTAVKKLTKESIEIPSLMERINRFIKK